MFVNQMPLIYLVMKKIYVHLIAILIFFVIPVIYFLPMIQGKKIQQSDMMQFQGMSKEIIDFREETGEEALWTNSMFGGMPASLISMKQPNNILKYVKTCCFQVLKKSISPFPQKPFNHHFHQ